MTPFGQPERQPRDETKRGLIPCHRMSSSRVVSAECPKFVHPRCNIQPEPMTIGVAIPSKVRIHVVVGRHLWQLRVGHPIRGCGSVQERYILCRRDLPLRSPGTKSLLSLKKPMPVQQWHLHEPKSCVSSWAPLDMQLSLRRSLKTARGAYPPVALAEILPRIQVPASQDQEITFDGG